MTPPPTTEIYQPPAIPLEAQEAPRKPSAKDSVERMRKPLSYVVAPLLCFLLIFVHPVGFGTLASEGVKLLGLLLVFAGALGRILCTLYIGGRKNRELCQTGIYAMCRNPLYFFSFLGFSGICLASQNLTLTLVAPSIFLILYRAVIQSEEKKLLRLFPVDFASYKKTTPRFWPRSLPLDDARFIQIDTRVFIRSLKEVLWFLVAIIGVEAIDILRTHDMIPLLLSWY